jgi:hypothetical protein
MTAVEFLKEQLNKILIDNQIQQTRHLFEQALEMEKQQIIDAVEWGNRKGYDEHRLTCILDEDEQYYNETYKPST